EIIIEQATTYENAGFGKNKGLCECGFILRRHTTKVKEFNNNWFGEYTRHSVRDQISFPVAVDNTGIRVNVIELPWHLSFDGLTAIRKNVVEMKPHIISNPTVQ